jgi:hypothetical protein
MVRRFDFLKYMGRLKNSSRGAKPNNRLFKPQRI